MMSGRGLAIRRHARKLEHSRFAGLSSPSQGKVMKRLRDDRQTPEMPADALYALRDVTARWRRFPSLPQIMSKKLAKG